MKCFKSIFIRFSIFSSHIYKSRFIFKGFGVNIYKFVHECIKPYSLNSYGYEHTYMAVLRQILLTVQIKFAYSNSNGKIWKHIK